MLELKNVTFKVNINGQEKEILKDINLKFDDKKFVVITGHNGSGKSTLARIISGILLPTSGQILFDGKDITNLNITERAKIGLGYAFQQPVKFKGLQVYDLLKIAAKGSLSLEQACNYLSKVGLCAGEYIRREVNNSLSGGELKRIEIATILAKQPKFSIFDEPEAGIDLWSFQNLIKIFNSMSQDIKDGTIVVISHQERILNIADEIIVLSNGIVNMQGSREEILPKILGTESAVMACKKLA
ncbi:MAG: ATP-binding cassette domain-containing protein [Elusimicrobia bacterium]|nr:ATP-binding cassette domain-containing protein [Elusimicrobiota bacterium]